MDRSTPAFWQSNAFRFLAACTSIATLTRCRYWFGLTNPTIAALGYRRIVLLTATLSTLKVAIVTSVLAPGEAIARGDELGRLFDVSRDVLLTTDSKEAIVQLRNCLTPI